MKKNIILSFFSLIIMFFFFSDKTYAIAIDQTTSSTTESTTIGNSDTSETFAESKAEKFTLESGSELIGRSIARVSSQDSDGFLAS